MLKSAGFATANADINAATFFRYRGSGGVLTFGFAAIGTGGLFPGKDKSVDSMTMVINKNFGLFDSAW
jgi:hypothetical protein